MDDEDNDQLHHRKMMLLRSEVDTFFLLHQPTVCSITGAAVVISERKERFALLLAFYQKNSCPLSFAQKWDTKTEKKHGTKAVAVVSLFFKKK